MNTTPMNTKKSWAKPQLLVLVRSQPEEAVLDSCKNFDASGGPGTSALNCGVVNVVCVACELPFSS